MCQSHGNEKTNSSGNNGLLKPFWLACDIQHGINAKSMEFSTNGKLMMNFAP